MYEYVCMYVYGNLPEQKIRFWSYPNFRGTILRYPQTVSKKFIFFLPTKLFFSRLNYFSDQLKLFFRSV